MAAKMAGVPGAGLSGGFDGMASSNGSAASLGMNSDRISEIIDVLSLQVRGNLRSVELFGLCLSLTRQYLRFRSLRCNLTDAHCYSSFVFSFNLFGKYRQIDFALANHEVPKRALELPSLLKKVCLWKHDTLMQAVIMVLMISVKNACQTGWFSDRDSEELSNLAKERLFVGQMDTIETSACLITPTKVNFLMNGHGVDGRNNRYMDKRPQNPTAVTHLLTYGLNVLQAVGEFNGNYLIAVACMSEVPQPDSNSLLDSEHAPPIVDSDSEIVEGPSRISLSCPIRKRDLGDNCFDFENYVAINSRRPSWRCPYCNQHVCFTDLRIDQKMILKEVGKNVTDVIFASDGSWSAVMATDDNIHTPEDRTSNSGQNESPETESVSLSNVPVEIIDLTQNDSMDVTPNETEDQKLSSIAQSRSLTQTVVVDPYRTNTNDVNQSNACAKDDTWFRIFMSTFGPGVPDLTTNTQNLHAYASTLNHIAAPAVLPEIPVTSLPNTLLAQQNQVGNPAMTNEYERFPLAPRQVSGTPIAVQAPHNMAPVLQETSTDIVNTFMHNGLPAAYQAYPTAPMNTNSTLISNRRHLPRSSSNYYPVIQQDSSLTSARLTQQNVTLQAPYQVPNAYRGIDGRQISSQQMVNLRMPQAPSQSHERNQSPSLRPGIHFSRPPAHLGGLQDRTGHANVLMNSQQALVAAANRAMYRALDPSRTLAAPTFSMNPETSSPPLVGDNVTSPANQNSRPAGWMRGAPAGQAFTDALNDRQLRTGTPIVDPMKCKSVACLWSGSPPLHRVTAVAALHEPPTLYTGGYDGSIIWWNFIASPEKTEMKPVAMLCGHTAPIADLGICFPLEWPESENLSDVSDLPANAINFGALISACTDGVLCVWSRASGHCTRRRKIPPWAGSPFILRPLPKNRRYVCISCRFPNQEHKIPNSTEGDESSRDGDLQNTNHFKFTVLVMDTYTLTLVQTVFHGNVSMGPLKSMAIVFSSEDMEKQLVMIIDSYGKVLYIPIWKDPVQKGKNVPSIPKDSHSPTSEVMDWMDDSEEKGLLVAFAKRGHVLALVHRTHCVFRRANSGTVFGNISFLDCQLCSEDLIYVVGGMFLGDDTETIQSGFVEEFVAWNNIGAAVMYRISYLSDKFKFELVHAIPAVLHPNMRMPIFFEPLKNYVIRVESNCSHYKEHMFWRPHVTIWRLDQQKDCHAKAGLESEMLGEGNLFDSWASNFSLPATDGLNHDVCREGKSDGDEMTSLQHNALSPNEGNGKYSSDPSLVSNREEQLVSCSMVISETYLAPYAIVYGFFNGDIKIVRFHMFFAALDSFVQSPNQEAGSSEQKHHLSGHRGEVICLASHQMVNLSAGCSLNHVLMSGSVDCTVRIWDLDSGDPITVLHQHVAPVRQIIPPPLQSKSPWNDCFLSIGDDSCVSLVSLQTLRVERLFPGHLHFPAKVVWDGVRGYIACLCQNNLEKSDNVLYIWDVKTGGCERILRGAAARSMFDHFLIAVNESSSSGNFTFGNTSASSLVFPVIEAKQFPQSYPKSFGKGISVQPLSAGNIHEPSETSYDMQDTGANNSSFASVIFQHDTHPIKSSCPFPGVSTLCFDLTSLMTLCSNHEFSSGGSLVGEKVHPKGAGTTSPEDMYQKENTPPKELGADSPSHHVDGRTNSIPSVVTLEHHEWVHNLERCLLQFSLSFLHFWNVDVELDNLLIAEMRLKRPDSFTVASGLLGDRGSMTLTFPGTSSTLELWRSSSEYSALRALTMVSLAQHLISLSHSYTSASSALAAFYMRKFAEKFSDIKPPLLQLLVSFWQHEFEHVKMASRSLFHCAASRAIPLSLCCSKNDNKHNMFRIGVPVKELESSTSVTVVSDERLETQIDNVGNESEITSWLDSYQVQDWISCVGATTQDAMTAQIIVAAALAVWYPFLVNSRLATVVVHSLVKLVMAMNEKYSAAAAEILAEGMESTWKACIGSDITRLIGEIFFQVECVSGTSANLSAQNTSGSVDIRETLVGILLPSLAMADIPGFLHVIESQIWSTASDSPVHVVSLVTLMRVVRGSPRNLAPYLDKTMDPGNSTMRKNCLKNSMSALKDVLRVFPMISLNDASTRLAVGDAIGEINNASIRVYDMQSMSKIKVLDASGPPGLPGLLGCASEMTINSAISALSFSPDGEGLAAFSENGLMIRWWSLSSVWWEKLNRNFVPVLCTKLIFIPPWEGFSPNSTRSSFLSSVLCDDGEANSPGSNKSSSEVDRLKLLIHNLDLSYRLEWVGEKKVKLTQHSRELGIFQL
ncbi:hypothetical protein F511_20355 [Dorcoceras hygrometricum]|uniref:Uncharacterized protein n=1 Tax=Dorcoceras hygrometricum TaxID=472368 RepID=A0A2Z7A8S9_9LAMI|nr:hypothetical protein F511_20355 [Dorcoceras hygrometricum]